MKVNILSCGGKRMVVTRGLKGLVRRERGTSDVAGAGDTVMQWKPLMAESLTLAYCEIKSVFLTPFIYFAYCSFFFFYF